MSNELETIKNKISLNKDYLKTTYGVEEIGVFGSFAREENHEKSDIDIAIELNHKIQVGIFDFARMKFYLEDLLDRKVDLVIKNEMTDD
jgi:predicted nucleotidyltransferase